jgi:hypothetical protein
MRITKKDLQAKVVIINAVLGHGVVEWNTVGAVRLSSACGGYGVHRVVNTSGGVVDLMGGHYTAKEADFFLSGMIAAFRLDK